MAVVAACLALMASCTPLPTEPVVTQYPRCTAIQVDIDKFDASGLADGTVIFSRLNYYINPPTPTPEIYISDGDCGPEGYPSGGWALYTVSNGKAYMIAW